MDIQKLANSIARKYGAGKATEISFAQVTDIQVSHIRFGWRKRTTGQYVPNAYRRKFGWKNTYYQEAITKITFPLWVGHLLEELNHEKE